MRIFFDLDGTLLDSRERLYRLFQHLVPASTLSFEAYWELKRNKTAHAEILSRLFGYEASQVSQFEREWLQLIELPEWLAYDQPFEGVSDFLARLKEQHTLYLITARQSRSGVMDQLKRNGWENVFAEVFVTGGDKDKYALISEVITADASDWFVGDTGKDVETGKLLGMRTAAVLSGFLSRASLERYAPDILVENVLRLPL